jgi:hypothetical protein
MSVIPTASTKSGPRVRSNPIQIDFPIILYFGIFNIALFLSTQSNDENILRVKLIAVLRQRWWHCSTMLASSTQQ